MRKSRVQFKYALRQCKKDSGRALADSLAANLLSKDDKSFWAEIKKINNTNAPLATTINYVSGEQPIVVMWKSKFETLLNSSTDSTKKQILLEAINDKSEHMFNRLTVSEVMMSIGTLKPGKSAGLDNISAEHIKYSHDRIAVL